MILVELYSAEIGARLAERYIIRHYGVVNNDRRSFIFIS